MFATFLRRLYGAALLNPDTYEEVEADRSATAQALAVVVLASLSAGIGARGAFGAGSAVRFFAVASVLSLAAWGAFALLTFEIGSRLLPTRETRVDVGELLRTLGFAAAPGLLQGCAIFSGMTVPVFTVVILWTLAASVVAVRQALDYTSTRRAIAVCGLAWGLSLAMVALLGTVVSSAERRLPARTWIAARGPQAVSTAVPLKITLARGIFPTPRDATARFTPYSHP